MENYKKEIKQLQTKLLLLFIIITTIISSIFLYIIQIQKTSYISDTTKTYERVYSTVYDQFKDKASLIASGAIKLSNIKNVLKQYDNSFPDEQDKLRQEVYNSIKDRYQLLKANHIKNINFITSDNKIFLKMNNPKKNGQTISNKRHTIKYIQKNHKQIDSYELGKNGEGFKFLFPILDGDNYLGAISITFGAEAITSTIMKQYDVLSNFLINRKNFNEKLLITKKKYYKIDRANDEYIMDMRSIKVLKEFSKKSFENLIPHPSTKETINSKIKMSKSFTFYSNYEMQTFTLLPVFNKLSKEHEGTIIIRGENPAIELLYTYRHIGLIMINLTLLIILLYIYQLNLKVINEKKLLEENLKKDKHILEQSKLAAMGEMIGNIAHQWRQPLSVISTSSTGILFHQEMGTLKEEQIIKDMNLINDNAQYLSRTIDDFKEFIQNKEETTKVSIIEALKQSIHLTEAPIKNNYIDLQIDLQDDIEIYANKNELVQSFINILNNAKDILIEKDDEKKYILVNSFYENNTLTISIFDSGGGIKENVINRIFEPYFTTKHKNKGTGLGLSMVHKILSEKYHAEIVVENKEKIIDELSYYGASFSITFHNTTQNESGIELFE